MSVQKRRKHTEEFKQNAVKLVLVQGYKISEAARRMHIIGNRCFFMSLGTMLKIQWGLCGVAAAFAQVFSDVGSNIPKAFEI